MRAGAIRILSRGKTRYSGCRQICAFTKSGGSMMTNGVRARMAMAIISGNRLYIDGLGRFIRVFAEYVL